MTVFCECVCEVCGGGCGECLWGVLPRLLNLNYSGELCAFTLGQKQWWMHFCLQALCWTGTSVLRFIHMDRPWVTSWMLPLHHAFGNVISNPKVNPVGTVDTVQLS